MIKIGARGSVLSTAQVNIVKTLLKEKLQLESEFIPIKSHGDINVSIPINKVVQEGAFTSTIETALLDGTVDLAVHSFKDLPTTNPDELGVVAILKRHSVNDVLIIHQDCVEITGKDFSLKKGTRIGTGSARRQSQLLHYYPDISTIDIRGNVETRLKKLANRQYDAILLASAVFQRIELHIPEGCVKLELDVQKFPTAPAQGAICLQMKRSHPLYSTIAQLNDDQTRLSVELERSILKAIGGGCQLPLGVTVFKDDPNWILNLTLAPKDWRDYVDIPLTKMHIKESCYADLSKQAKLLLPASSEEEELVLQNKEIIFFGNEATIAKYDNAVSSYGAISTVIDVQEIFPNLAKELYEKHADAWLKADWVIVTSKNAIKSINLFNKYYPKNNLKIASVGFSTTKLLQKSGYAVHYQGESSNADSLLKGLKTIISKEDKIFYVSAANAKKTLRSTFEAEGYTFNQVEVYTSVPKTNLPDIPNSASFDYCVVFSPEYARIAIEKYGQELGKTWVSIGPSTTKRLQELGITNYKQLEHVTVKDLLEVLQ